MAIVNTIALTFPGYGQATSYTLKNAALSATTTTTQTLTSAVRNGRIRVKYSAVNGATTLQTKITMTDGTTTFVVLPTTPVSTAGDLQDFVIDYNLDINANSISVVSTLAGATQTATLDIEVAGNP
jgi:hypothetical protein